MTKPPSRCPNGHALGPNQVLVGHVACLGHGGGGHTTWHCRTCEAVVYGPPLNDHCTPCRDRRREDATAENRRNDECHYGWTNCLITSSLRRCASSMPATARWRGFCGVFRPTPAPRCSPTIKHLSSRHS